MQPFHPSRVSTDMRNAEPKTAAPPADTAATIICRPGKAAAGWVTVAGMLSFYCGAAVAALLGAGPGNQIGMAFSAVCFALCVTWLTLAIVWARRGAITADEAGLRWRELGAWKCVGWGEVSDYYVRRSGQNANETVIAAVIETAAGRINFGSPWTGSKPLQEAVERQATAAAAREWGLLGTRPCDPWPRRFGYDTFSNRWSPRLLVKLSLMFVVYVLVKPALSLTGLAALVGWRMTLTTAALYLLLTMPLAVLLLVRPLLDYRAVQKRMGERITLTPEGLVFEDGTRRVDARWEEVTGYGIANGKYTVETGGGAFDFLGSIGNGLLLRENIRLSAAKVADTEWKARVDPEALGGEAARWSGGQVGVGARVFHYRIRSYRMMLMGALCVYLLGCGIGIATNQGWLPGGNPPPMGVAVGGTLLIAILWGIGWRIYQHCGVHLDDDGLTQLTPLGQTRLMWTQVNNFYLGSDGVSIVEGQDGRRIRFSSMIVGREELKAEIGRRGAHCGRTEWQKRPPA